MPDKQPWSRFNPGQPQREGEEHLAGPDSMAMGIK
jgi:hypothetical protein